MYVLLRIVAVFVMLLAVLFGAIEMIYSITGSDSTEKASTLSLLSRGFSNLYAPAAQFCLGAILFVLIRIASIQEEELPSPVEPATR